MANDQIKCPKCGAEIPITEVLGRRLEEQVNDKVKNRLQAEREQILADFKKKMEAEQALSIKKVEQELAEKKAKLAEAEAKELQNLKLKNELEEKLKKQELIIARKIEEEKLSLTEKIRKEEEEKNRFKLLEKEKQLEDTKKALAEAQRKALQGSMQTQGEVLELELEKQLKETFPHDQINPVSKGIRGGDVIQTVCSPSGKICGKIIWETKNAKVFQQGWIAKLKEDSRNEKADVAIIISDVLPEGIGSFDRIDGVWVTKFDFVVGLATALRTHLIEMTRTKLSVASKNETTELLYNYITGSEFKQRVEAIAEAWKSLQNDLAAERRLFERVWAKREKELGKVVNHTWGMYGDLEGLVGRSLSPIENLQLAGSEEFEEAETEKNEEEAKKTKPVETNPDQANLF